MDLALVAECETPALEIVLADVTVLIDSSLTSIVSATNVLSLNHRRVSTESPSLIEITYNKLDLDDSANQTDVSGARLQNTTTSAHIVHVAAIDIRRAQKFTAALDTGPHALTAIVERQPRIRISARFGNDDVAFAGELVCQLLQGLADDSLGDCVVGRGVDRRHSVSERSAQRLCWYRRLECVRGIVVISKCSSTNNQGWQRQLCWAAVSLPDDFHVGSAMLYCSTQNLRGMQWPSQTFEQT